MSLLLQEWGRHTGELWGSVAEKTRGFYMVLRVAELQLKALCRILTGGASLTQGSQAYGFWGILSILVPLDTNGWLECLAPRNAEESQAKEETLHFCSWLCPLPDANLPFAFRFPGIVFPLASSPHPPFWSHPGEPVVWLCSSQTVCEHYFMDWRIRWLKYNHAGRLLLTLGNWKTFKS